MFVCPEYVRVGMCTHLPGRCDFVSVIKYTTVCVCVSACWLSIVVNDCVNQSLGQLSRLYRFKLNVSHRYILAGHERLQRESYICIKHNNMQ